MFGEALEDLESCGQSELLRELEVGRLPCRPCGHLHLGALVCTPLGGKHVDGIVLTCNMCVCTHPAPSV